jgi:EmrB/QacA subfamily drug resistance transporter
METVPMETLVEDRTRWTALYTLCGAMLMMVLDVTVVNVALPSIQDDLHFTDAGLAWVVNGYLIAFAGLLLLSGRLGDLLGRRRVLLAGLVVFTVASLLCGAAQTQTVLVGARFLQGVGGALASAVVLGMIVTLFPEEGEQMKALGVYGFVASAGGAVGLVAGGLITQVISWHWIFFVNVPIGVVVVATIRRVVPADDGIGLDKGADVPGAVLITGALMVSVYALVGPGAKDGLGAPLTLGLLAAGAALLAAFVGRQATAATPLMPLRLFRSRTTVGANLVQTLTVAGMFGMFFLSSLYLQRVLGYDALQIGLAFFPCTVLMAVISLRVADRVVARYGAQHTLTAGSALAAVGLVLFGFLPVDGHYLTDVLPGITLLGVGSGIGFPALMGIAMSEATPEDAGLASGLVGTTAEAGAAVGLAVLATIAAGRSSTLTGRGLSEASALVGGYHLAFLLGAGFLTLATALSAGLLKERR